jgi:hypothetical protein
LAVVKEAVSRGGACEGKQEGGNAFTIKEHSPNAFFGAVELAFFAAVRLDFFGAVGVAVFGEVPLVFL